MCCLDMAAELISRMLRIVSSRYSYAWLDLNTTVSEAETVSLQMLQLQRHIGR